MFLTKVSLKNWPSSSSVIPKGILPTYNLLDCLIAFKVASDWLIPAMAAATKGLEGLGRGKGRLGGCCCNWTGGITGMGVIDLLNMVALGKGTDPAEEIAADPAEIVFVFWKSPSCLAWSAGIFSKPGGALSQLL